MTDFVLDPRLQADTLPIGDLPLSRALLMNDRRYPWVILVPRVASVSEVLDLAPGDRERLWQESLLVSEVLRERFEGDKLNLGALGNLVPQLHLHHLLRRRDDPAWPGPAWGHSPPEPYPEDLAGETLAILRQALGC